MVAGTTTYARSSVTSTCCGSPRVTKYSEAPSLAPATKTSRYQSRQAVGPCQTCGTNPSSTLVRSAQLAAIVSTSPLLNASTYCRTAPIGPIVSDCAADAAAHANATTKIALRTFG